MGPIASAVRLTPARTYLSRDKGTPSANGHRIALGTRTHDLRMVRRNLMPANRLGERLRIKLKVQRIGLKAIEQTKTNVKVTTQWKLSNCLSVREPLGGRG